MTTHFYSTSTEEIPAKGIGYLTVYDSASLRPGVEDLIRHGAVTICASGPIREGERDGLSITPLYDVVRLSRALEGAEPPEGRLSLRPLSHANGAVFLAIYNESVIRLSGYPSQTIADLSWLISEDWYAGIAWAGETPVGIYECNCAGPTPEIVALTVLEAWRGKGLGRELLRQLLVLLAADGFDRCAARIATNSDAFPLLRAEGFRAEELLSRWYDVKVLPEC